MDSSFYHVLEHDFYPVCCWFLNFEYCQKSMNFCLVWYFHFRLYAHWLVNGECFDSICYSLLSLEPPALNTSSMRTIWHSQSSFSPESVYQFHFLRLKLLVHYLLHPLIYLIHLRLRLQIHLFQRLLHVFVRLDHQDAFRVFLFHYSIILQCLWFFFDLIQFLSVFLISYF